MSSLIKVTVGLGILVLLFALIPTIAIPDEIYQFIISGALYDIFKLCNYFVPLNFIFGCIIFMYTIRYAGIFVNMINWIYHKIF